MKVTKEVNEGLMQLSIEIDGVKFREVVFLSSKSFEVDTKKAVAILQTKIENYKKAMELDLVSLLGE